MNLEWCRTLPSLIVSSGLRTLAPAAKAQPAIVRVFTGSAGSFARTSFCDINRPPSQEKDRQIARTLGLLS